jgi:hypothetical protein
LFWTFDARGIATMLVCTILSSGEVTGRHKDVCVVRPVEDILAHVLEGTDLLNVEAFLVLVGGILHGSLKANDAFVYFKDLAVGPFFYVKPAASLLKKSGANSQHVGNLGDGHVEALPKEIVCYALRRGGKEPGTSLELFG